MNKKIKTKDGNYSVIMHITPELKVFFGATNKSTWIYEGHWRGSALEQESKRFGWNNINHVLVEDNLNKDDALKIRKHLIEKGGCACLNQRTVTKMDIETNILNNRKMKKERQTALMTSTVNGVKLSLTFDNRYESKSGYPVVVRVYKDRLWTYVRTGYSMSANEFRKCDSDVLSVLEDKYNAVKDWCVRSVSDGTFDIKSAKDCLNKAKVNRTLAGLMELKMDTVPGQGTRINYRSAMNYVYKTFSDGLPVDKINQTTVGEIVSKLKEDGKTDTTINVYLSCIKASLNYAIYKGFFEQSNYPFKKNAWECDKVAIPKSAKRQDRWIDQGEMKAIWNTFAANTNKKSNKWLGVFLFSYLTGGINLADLVDLKFTKEWTTKGVLRFTRKKTAHKKSDTIAVPVSSHVERLLDIMGIEPVEGNPVFPFLQGEYYKTKSTAASNLNRILAKHGISMTYARHSFATIATKNKMPASMVEQSMGHSLPGVASHYIAGWNVDEMRPYFEQLL